ncbi:rRNA maturation RNase YbeY [Rickettsiales bacterium (ex Bugula neritina AB1)]|nr:rRNA maturation RNase YbeY [Rickettsiales bacterium (ex Bugula neritina AB1)]
MKNKKMKKNNILILHHNKQWIKYIKVIKKLANFVLTKKYQQTTLSILLTNSNYMQNMNNIYRKKNYDTNVLSFPIDKEILGEVILSYGKITEELNIWKRDFQTHTLYLLIHGILHLLGYDHIVNEEALIMELEEEYLMNKFILTTKI